MATQEFEDVLDRILSEIEPDHVPAEFVQGACVTDLDDEVYVVSREELEEIMLDEDSLEDQGIREIGLILNLASVKETILHFSEIILKDIAL
jgi:hypothetical protein